MTAGMTLHLHNPVNQAHIEDLRDRLTSHLSVAPVDQYNRMQAAAVVGTLVGVVRALDLGVLSAADAVTVFAQFCVPGFSFVKWRAEMMDEGVYVDIASIEAA
jgi:hypothetical protein